MFKSNFENFALEFGMYLEDQSRADIPNDLQITTAVPVYAAGAGGFGGSGLTLRKDFPESWIWETIDESRFVAFSSPKPADFGPL